MRTTKRRGRIVRAGTLAGAVVLDLLFFRPAGLNDVQPVILPSGASWSLAIAAQERHNEDLLSREGVAGTAVAIGLDGRPAVKVYLTGPEILGIPASLDGFPVMTEVTGAFYALGDMPEDAEYRTENEPLDPKQSFPRPVPIGVSTGQVDVTAGTIGARVAKGDDVFALSNNHVYANKNQAKLGDRILQPGRVDGGSETDAIGTLHDFEPIRFCSPFPACPNNRIDAAIAATTTDDLGNRTPRNGYGTPQSNTAKARLGLAVQKYGRTTGHTLGQISGLNATMNVGFRDGTARFVGQIVISGRGFSAPGDSGSLIVTQGDGNDGRRPVGLLFAGSESTTLANPVEDVLKRFGITIDGSE